MAFRPLQALKTAAALTAVGGVLAGKVALARWYIRRRQAKQKLQGNRVQFSKMPRVYQRGVLAYRRAQLKDLENIYRQGYVPRPKALPKIRTGRRRRW